MGGQNLPWEFDPELEGKLSTKPSERFPVSLAKSSPVCSKPAQPKSTKQARERMPRVDLVMRPSCPSIPLCNLPHTFTLEDMIPYTPQHPNRIPNHGRTSRANRTTPHQTQTEPLLLTASPTSRRRTSVSRRAPRRTPLPHSARQNPRWALLRHPRQQRAHLQIRPAHPTRRAL